jgi:hypothetical protein
MALSLQLTCVNQDMITNADSRDRKQQIIAQKRGKALSESGGPALRLPKNK